jgi:O-antigen/teichoic acid export membrane protein
LSSDAGRRKTQLAMADQAVVSAANFMVGLLLGRFLGPTAYGQFTLTYYLILFASTTQFALIVAPMLVIGPQLAPDRSPGYYCAVRVLLGALSLLLGVAALLGVQTLSALFPSWGLAGLALPVSVALLFCVAQDFARRYWFVRNQADAALISDITTYGVRILLLCALGLSAGLNANSAFWVLALSCVMGLLAVSLGYRWRRADAHAGGKDALRQASEQHWHAGKWLLAENLVYWFGGQMLIFFIAGHVLSATVVGNITASMSVVGASNILFLALENFVPSRAAQMYAMYGAPGLKRYLHRVAVLGGGLTLILVGVGALWAEFWLGLLYGPAYAGNGALVAWGGAFYFIGFFQRPLSFGLRVLGQTRAIFFAAATAATVCLTLAYPLMRFAGVTGAMLALCLVQLAALLASAFSFRRALARQAP